MNKSMRRLKGKRSGTKRSGKRGGMFRPGEKKNEAMLRNFFTSPEGVDPTSRLSALSGPFSGTFGFAADRLLQPSVQAPRSVRESIHDTMSSLKRKRLADEMFKSAERLHATSFHSKNLAKCAELNGRAVEQLKRAIGMGSVRARACLADMLLTGNTVGVKKDVNAAKALVCQDPMCKGFLAYEGDPDCKGVLAHYCLNDGLWKHANRLARESAAHGSKYGQFVLGLLEWEMNPTQAKIHFEEAAAQNYDAAQITLSGFPPKGSKPDTAEALRLLNLAAEQGNAHAFFSIAQIHSMDATHNKQSFHQALHWFKLAEDGGHPHAHDVSNIMKLNVGFGRG